MKKITLIYEPLEVLARYIAAPKKGGHQTLRAIRIIIGPGKLRMVATNGVILMCVEHYNEFAQWTHGKYLIDSETVLILAKARPGAVDFCPETMTLNGVDCAPVMGDSWPDSAVDRIARTAGHGPVRANGRAHVDPEQLALLQTAARKLLPKSKTARYAIPDYERPGDSGALWVDFGTPHFGLFAYIQPLARGAHEDNLRQCWDPLT